MCELASLKCWTCVAAACTQKTNPSNWKIKVGSQSKLNTTLAESASCVHLRDLASEIMERVIKEGIHSICPLYACAHMGTSLEHTHAFPHMNAHMHISTHTTHIHMRKGKPDLQIVGATKFI